MRFRRRFRSRFRRRGRVGGHRFSRGRRRHSMRRGFGRMRIGYRM